MKLPEIDFEDPKIQKMIDEYIEESEKKLQKKIQKYKDILEFYGWQLYDDGWYWLCGQSSAGVRINRGTIIVSIDSDMRLIEVLFSRFNEQ